nr:hypothetical protein [Clostridium chromiireducens]
MESVQRIMCPKCCEGFVVNKDFREDLGYLGERIVMPMTEIPYCNKCLTKFSVEVDTKNLIIRIREYYR